MDPRPDLCLEDYLAVAEWPGPPVEWIDGQRGGWFRVDRTDGEVVLDPPGVTLGIDDLYTGLDAVGSSGSAARTEDS